MKKISLIGVFAFLIAGNAGATAYTTTKDQIRSSYKKVTESGSKAIGFALSCSDAGDDKCVYKDGHIPPMVKAMLEEVDQAVNINVQSNSTFGTVEFDGGYYSWQTDESGQITTNVVVFD